MLNDTILCTQCKNCQKWPFYSLTISETHFLKICLDSSGPVEVYRTNQSPSQKSVAEGPSSKVKISVSSSFRMVWAWPFWWEDSQLLAVWATGISCLMEMLKSSLCVRWEMLERFPRSQPRWVTVGTVLQQAAAAQPEPWGVPVWQCPMPWVTTVGSPGCQESPRWEQVDMPTLCWITWCWVVPALSIPVSVVSCLGRKR